MNPIEDPRFGISESERARRVLVLVHTALLAGVGIYAVILIFLRAEIATVRGARPASDSTLFLVLAGVGLAQYAAAAWLGRAFLRTPRSRPVDRVRLSFLLRGAAAEAIALYGLILGFMGGSWARVLALLALAFVGLLACSPGKAAWEAAMRTAEGSPPGAS